MRKVWGMSGLLLVLASLLQACAIPPAPIKWRTEPGRIQRVNVSPLVPANNSSHYVGL